MNVVFDTHVLVSAFVAEGVCSKLLGRARRRQFHLIASSFILKEFETVLLKKISATKGETREAFRVLAEAIYNLVEPSSAISGICRDPDDDPILSCTLAAGADYLGTGDSDLLELKEFQGTRILSPREFESILED